MGIGISFPEVKRPGHEADNWPPATIEVRTFYNYNCIPLSAVLFSACRKTVLLIHSAIGNTHSRITTYSLKRLNSIENSGNNIKFCIANLAIIGLPTHAGYCFKFSNNYVYGAEHFLRSWYSLS